MTNDPDLIKGERLENLRKNARLREILKELADDYDSPLETFAVDASWWAETFKADLEIESSEDADAYLARGLVDKLREIARYATERADYIAQSLDALDA